MLPKGTNSMKSFEWDQHFVTGLSTVDEQHHKLVDLINQFGALSADNDVDKGDLENVFTELKRYTVYHFREEEEMMRSLALDDRHMNPHVSAHQRFIEEIELWSKDAPSDETIKTKQLLEFLIYWLAYHILGSDQNMARQVKAVEGGMDPTAAYDQFERKADRSTEPLLAALNGLFKLVSIRNRELLELNRSLEQKVEDRTQELVEANASLEVLATTDMLSGLPNRRHAMIQLASYWSESAQHQTPLSCMMIDADQFKQINDTYGHDAGDDVIKALARTLSHAVRSDDLVCRLGGDEFLIICPNTDHSGAIYLAEQIHRTVSELRVPTGAGFWEGSISVGVATSSQAIDTKEALIKLADEGLYEAKSAGKNCVRSLVFTR